MSASRHALDKFALAFLREGSCVVKHPNMRLLRGLLNAFVREDCSRYTNWNDDLVNMAIHLHYEDSTIDAETVNSFVHRVGKLYRDTR